MEFVCIYIKSSSTSTSVFTHVEVLSSGAPTTVSTFADSDYEAAALSEALGHVAVTKQAKTHSRLASVSQCLQPVSPEPVGLSLSFGLSPRSWLLRRRL
uniref:Transposase n=1 Tax=Peronospora matthiolae TaxID=2874970 RepID=A0AAV1TPU3_9STRA